MRKSKKQYTPKAIDTSSVELSFELLKLTEKLAENAHDNWAKLRMEEGWTWGAERNDALRQHPDLIPYNEYCQVNVIQTTQPINGFIPLLLGHNFGARHLTPFAKCPRSKLPIVNRSRQMPAQPEQITYHTVNRKKTLCTPR